MGRLLSLNQTQPDVTFTLNDLSQIMEDPREDHLKEAYGVLSYIKCTVGQGLLLKLGRSQSVEIYIDCDSAGLNCET